MKLRYKCIETEAVPKEVKYGKWRVSPRSKYYLTYGTQTCKFTDDDGAIVHFAYVQRGNRRKGPWLYAIERLGQDVSQSS